MSMLRVLVSSIIITRMQYMHSTTAFMIIMFLQLVEITFMVIFQYLQPSITCFDYRGITITNLRMLDNRGSINSLILISEIETEMKPLLLLKLLLLVIMFVLILM